MRTISTGAGEHGAPDDGAGPLRAARLRCIRIRLRLVRGEIDQQQADRLGRAVLDRAPNHDLLFASLLACAALMAQVVADREGTGDPDAFFALIREEVLRG